MFSRFPRFVVVLLVLCSIAHPLDLVKDGRAVATIVVAETAEAQQAGRSGKSGRSKQAANPDQSSEAEAVALLVDWVRKMTDVELPVAQVAPSEGTAIFIGKAALSEGLRVNDIVSPSREGLRISVDGRRVLIGGQSDGATFRGVARFLEEMGCRCLMDGPLGEVFPRGRTLSVGALSITEKPGLMWRNPKGPSWRSSLWRKWNGGGGDTIQHGHAWGSYLPKDLFDRHPEWFALGADGQRRRGDWLCTSNSAAREFFADQVCAAIERGNRNPSISPPDGRGYCQCEKCRAQDDPKVIEPSSGTISVSTRYADFFDDVARRVATKHPESILSFYCYADYTQPPSGGKKLAPNLCAVIAPIRYCRLHGIGHRSCPTREQAVKMIEGWASVAKRIGYYNYMYNLADATLPTFKFTACKTEIPWLADRGLSHMTMEVLTNWHIYGPQMHLGLKLAYDPGADAAAILEDYCLKFYGPKAGPLMKEYWMGIDAAMNAAGTHAGGFFGLDQIYTEEFSRRCAALLERAAEAARGDAAQEQRVALHAEGFRSVGEYRAVCRAMALGDFAGAKTSLDGMIERLRGLAAKGWANSEYGTAYLERFLSKTVNEGAALTVAPNRLLAVLPERWRFAFDEDDKGNESGWHQAGFDASRWPEVTTAKTLDAQGFDRNTILWFRTTFTVPEKHGRLVLFFGEVDGASEVYVNGSKVPVSSKGEKKAEVPKPPQPGVREGMAKARVPFDADVTDACRPGVNTVALRVDHSKITELALGGILRPVLLIEKPE